MIGVLLEGFLMRAILAGVGVAVAAAPMGCFVVWRRMAYFGDATAHAAVLGVALALAAGAPILAGVVIVALAAGVIVGGLAGRGQSADTLLGVVSHGALAMGLVAVSLLPGVRVDLSAFLFGDILAVTRSDLVLIWGGAALVAGLMAWRWEALLTVTLSEELAIAEGLRPRRERLILTLALALVVAVAIKVVGALLIGAMLLIPAATARAFASTPERMVGLAALIGAVAVAGGMAFAWFADTPAGPSIVCCALAGFGVSLLWARAGA